MTTALILNAVFFVLIVAAILALLGWGIVSDRAMAATLTQGRSDRVRKPVTPFEYGRDQARVRATRPARRRIGRALGLGAST